MDPNSTTVYVAARSPELPRPSGTFTGTWLGRPGTDTHWRTGSGTHSLRVIHHVWTDGSGESHVIVMSGDGRIRPDADHPKAPRTLARLDNPTLAQVADLIATWVTLPYLKGK